MARIKNIPKEVHLDFLRKELAKKNGWNILTSSDCKLLSEKMNGIVSSDTLRRLFNIIKNNNTISIKSLNHCSVFCGFTDWNNLIDGYNKRSVNNNKIILLKCLQRKIDNKEIIDVINDLIVSKEVFDLFIQIILIKAYQEDKDFFMKIFEFEPLFVDIEKNRYEIYYLIHLLSSLCQNNKWMQEIAVEHYYNLDSNNTYQFDGDFFVEWLVTPQFEFYRTLLQNYHREKKDNKSVNAFYHLVLADYYLDIEDWDKFNSHFREIKKIDFKEITHNILVMRLKGVKLIYAFKFNPSYFDNLCLEINKINFWNLYDDLGDRITSLLFICISLHKCEQYKIISDIIKKSFGKYDLITTQWSEQNWNQLKVIYSNSLMKTNQIKVAKEVFNTISRDNIFDINFSYITTEIYEKLEISL